MAQRQMLTTDNGPVFIGEKTLSAMQAIRREGLIEKIHGPVLMARSNYNAATNPPPWITPVDDVDDYALSMRVASAASPSEAITLKTALANGASLILIDGPVKEQVKLSFIKAEGVVPMLVTAYREGWLSAVRPMVKALIALGHEDVLPPPEALDALWTALDHLADA